LESDLLAREPTALSVHSNVAVVSVCRHAIRTFTISISHANANESLA
jgi:hypothetical protein